MLVVWPSRSENTATQMMSKNRPHGVVSNILLLHVRIDEIHTDEGHPQHT